MRWPILLLLLCATLGAAPPPPSVSLAAARRLLPVATACDDIECLLESAYQADPEARDLALALWRETGNVAGVGAEEVLDGGFRGMIQLVPQLPVKRYRKHLLWLTESSRALDHFFSALFPGDLKPNYRVRALEFRFVRSVNKHRPSAYALGWTVSYNVLGSLNISEKSVRETLFHELFHANDEAHGNWSSAQLRADYQAILRKCGAHPSVSCLAPYAPNDTMVRGGTFYAFQPNNGDTVHEYGAELAVRYFKEQSEMLAAGKLTRRAFKCGPVENGRAWQALVGEFFAGRDLVPPC